MCGTRNDAARLERACEAAGIGSCPFLDAQWMRKWSRKFQGACPGVLRNALSAPVTLRATSGGCPGVAVGATTGVAGPDVSASVGCGEAVHGT